MSKGVANQICWSIKSLVPRLSDAVARESIDAEVKKFSTAPSSSDELSFVALDRLDGMAGECVCLLLMPSKGLRLAKKEAFSLIQKGRESRSVLRFVVVPHVSGDFEKATRLAGELGVFVLPEPKEQEDEIPWMRSLAQVVLCPSSLNIWLSNLLAGQGGLDVFISYSSNDFVVGGPEGHKKYIAESLRDRISEAIPSSKGRVWVDQTGLGGGDNWKLSLQSTVKSASIVFLCITKSFLEKCQRENDEEAWTRHEVIWAIRSGRKVIPLIVGETDTGREELLAGWNELKTHEKFVEQDVSTESLQAIFASSDFQYDHTDPKKKFSVLLGELKRDLRAISDFRGKLSGDEWRFCDRHVVNQITSLLIQTKEELIKKHSSAAVAWYDILKELNVRVPDASLRQEMESKGNECSVDSAIRILSISHGRLRGGFLTCFRPVRKLTRRFREIGSQVDIQASKIGGVVEFRANQWQPGTTAFESKLKQIYQCLPAYLWSDPDSNWWSDRASSFSAVWVRSLKLFMMLCGVVVAIASSICGFTMSHVVAEAPSYYRGNYAVDVENRQLIGGGEWSRVKNTVPVLKSGHDVKKPFTRGLWPFFEYRLVYTLLDEDIEQWDDAVIAQDDLTQYKTIGKLGRWFGPTHLERPRFTAPLDLVLKSSRGRISPDFAKKALLNQERVTPSRVKKEGVNRYHLSVSDYLSDTPMALSFLDYEDLNVHVDFPMDYLRTYREYEHELRRSGEGKSVWVPYQYEVILTPKKGRVDDVRSDVTISGVKLSWKKFLGRVGGHSSSGDVVVTSFDGKRMFRSDLEGSLFAGDMLVFRGKDFAPTSCVLREKKEINDGVLKPIHLDAKSTIDVIELGFSDEPNGLFQGLEVDFGNGEVRAISERVLRNVPHDALLSFRHPHYEFQLGSTLMLDDLAADVLLDATLEAIRVPVVVKSKLLTMSFELSGEHTPDELTAVSSKRKLDCMVNGDVFVLDDLSIGRHEWLFQAQGFEDINRSFEVMPDGNKPISLKFELSDIVVVEGGSLADAIEQARKVGGGMILLNGVPKDRGPWVIDVPVTIKGGFAPSSSRALSIAENHNGSVFEIKSPDVTLENLWIEHPGEGTHLKFASAVCAYGVTAEIKDISRWEDDVAANLYLVNCVLKAPGCGFFMVGQEASAVMKDCLVKHCGVNGVMVVNSASLTMDDCSVLGNGQHGVVVLNSASLLLKRGGIKENGKSGLFLSGAGKVEAREALFFSNVESGVYASGINGKKVESATIKNCTMQGDGRGLSGVSVSGYGEVNIEGGEISGHVRQGIQVEGDACLVLKPFSNGRASSPVKICENKRIGLYVFGDAFVKSEGAVLDRNGSHGVQVGNNSGGSGRPRVELSGGSICNNGQYGINEVGKVTVEEKGVVVRDNGYRDRS